MKLSDNFPDKSYEDQKKEMRSEIAKSLKDGEDMGIDLWLYKNHTEEGIPIEAWLQSNDSDDDVE